MKWKNIGYKMYESLDGKWQIENQKTWLNPHRGWYIRREGVYVDNTHTLGAAKILVQTISERTPPL